MQGISPSGPRLEVDRQDYNVHAILIGCRINNIYLQRKNKQRDNPITTTILRTIWSTSYVRIDGEWLIKTPTQRNLPFHIDGRNILYCHRPYWIQTFVITTIVSFCFDPFQRHIPKRREREIISAIWCIISRRTWSIPPLSSMSARTNSRVWTDRFSPASTTGQCSDFCSICFS